MIHRYIQLVAGVVLAASGITVGVIQLAAAEPVAHPQRDTPPPKTIVSVAGDEAHGFRIEHYDVAHT